MLLIVVVALVIGLFRVEHSGFLWDDESDYVNAAAMIHDWLRSGELLQPYRFAERNYIQYPAFNIPFHPPVYPALLGITFLASGVSYFAARAFVSSCLALAGVAFWWILRRLGTRCWVSLTCALLFVTTPEIVHWSRSTMSEVPALALMLVASCTFVSWTERPSWSRSWLAFGLAELAFLSRVTTAGVMMAWPLYLLSGRSTRRLLFSRPFLAGSAVYLGVNTAWVRWAVGYARNETVENKALTTIARLSWENFAYYPEHLPEMVGWPALAAAVLAILLAVSARGSEPPSRVLRFSLAWFLGYFAFQIGVAANEVRYFTFCLPSVSGLVATLLEHPSPHWVRRWLGPLVAILSLASNTFALARQPAGGVGYASVASAIAALDRPGNLLISVGYYRDLVFRYRAEEPHDQRQIIRADRTLAISYPSYAMRQTQPIAKGDKDVLDIIYRGRIRYVVSCGPPLTGRRLAYKPEARLLHDTALSHPDLFRMLGAFSLHVDLGPSLGADEGQVFLWEFLGTLPEGPSELPVIIPTADMVLRPQTE